MHSLTAFRRVATEGKPKRDLVVAPSTPTLPLHAVLELQRRAGNQAVARLLARDAGPSGGLELLPPSSDTPERRAKIVERLGPVEVATVHQQLKAKPDANGKLGIDLPAGSYLIDAAEVEALRPVARARKEQVFKDFAARRQPLFDAMTAAAEPEARHEAIAQLSQFDEGELPTLVQMQDTMRGQWDIENAAARDAVLAAIQLQAATDAQGELSGKSDEIRTRVKKAAGMESSTEWCGFFTVDHFVRARMDSDLRAGFFHTNNVQDFFHYRYDRNPKRIKKWIWVDDAWQELNEYHKARDAERQWLDYEELSAGGELDIRPGYTVLVDRGLDGTPDHIVTAVSYDPATNSLVTIGGNDSGFVVVPPGTKKPTDTDPKRDAAEAATGLDLQKGKKELHVGVSVHNVAATAGARGAIFGVGRPSLVDFEDHIYAWQPQKKPPPPLKKA